MTVPLHGWSGSSFSTGTKLRESRSSWPFGSLLHPQGPAQNEVPDKHPLNEWGEEKAAGLTETSL